MQSAVETVRQMRGREVMSASTSLRMVARVAGASEKNSFPMRRTLAEWVWRALRMEAGGRLIDEARRGMLLPMSEVVVKAVTDGEMENVSIVKE